MQRAAAFLLALSVVCASGSAWADPPTLRAAGSLREGLVVEGCRGARCEPWVRFPARPYRSFVEARVSPSGRFFYVWSRPDGSAREIDVFAVPTREAQLANRRGHWSPGAGGELAWVAGDHLWHAWRCGIGCTVAQLYSATGATLLSLTGRDIDRSRDGRFAVSATRSEAVLVDLAHATMRTHRGPKGLLYTVGSLAVSDGYAELAFEPASHDDNDRTDGARSLRISLAAGNPVVQVARTTGTVMPSHATRPTGAVTSLHATQSAGAVTSPHATRPTGAVTSPHATRPTGAVTSPHTTRSAGAVTPSHATRSAGAAVSARGPSPALRAALRATRPSR